MERIERTRLCCKWSHFINRKIGRIPGLDPLLAQVDDVDLNVRTLVGDDAAAGTADIACANAANVVDLLVKQLARTLASSIAVT